MNYNNGKYDDIINLPHHVSKKHPQMSLEARSAQFAPFAALTGYDDVIDETVRATTERIEINEELRAILDNKLQKIEQQISRRPEIKFTYFVPDLKKEGGSYQNITGKVIRIDKYKQVILLEDKTEIPIAEIIDMETAQLGT